MIVEGLNGGEAQNNKRINMAEIHRTRNTNTVSGHDVGPS